MGNYHPHGDSSIYDTLVRMAQPFSMRCRLVDGQGNFGSVDGDPPAAMRYTEARMTALAEALLDDIDKDTVDFRPNYDDTSEEPECLPAAVPNLLVNGGTGIAVGMGDQYPAAQSGRDHRRGDHRDQPPQDDSRGSARNRARPRLPHRRHDLRDRGIPQCLPHRPPVT